MLALWLRRRKYLSGWAHYSTIRCRPVLLQGSRTALSIRDFSRIAEERGSPSLALKPRGNGTNAGLPGPKGGRSVHRHVLRGASLAEPTIHCQEVLRLFGCCPYVFRRRGCFLPESRMIFQKVLLGGYLSSGRLDLLLLFLPFFRK